MPPATNKRKRRRQASVRSFFAAHPDPPSSPLPTPARLVPPPVPPSQPSPPPLPVAAAATSPPPGTIPSPPPATISSPPPDAIPSPPPDSLPASIPSTPPDARSIANGPPLAVVALPPATLLDVAPALAPLSVVLLPGVDYTPCLPMSSIPHPNPDLLTDSASTSMQTDPPLTHTPIHIQANNPSPAIRRDHESTTIPDDSSASPPPVPRSRTRRTRPRPPVLTADSSSSPPRTRPRTRAATRAARSPSPSPTPSPPQPPLPITASRLNRARNLARQVRAREEAMAHATPPTLSSESDSVSGEPDPDCVVVETETAGEVVPVPTIPRQLRGKKTLHPFFAAAAAAVSTVRERPKAARIDPARAELAADFYAHVNVGELPPALDFASSRAAVATTILDGEDDGGEMKESRASFSYYPSESGLDGKLRELSPRPMISAVKCESSEAWAERYKRDTRIDVINGAVSKELVDWLRSWYEKTKPAERSDSEDSMDLMEDIVAVDERERVALVTGPVGCGKSTVVASAARQLGLSVLEINASTCRTGRRIREIIGEALRTHRVGGLKQSSARGGGAFSSFAQTSKTTETRNATAKTLILFEEVDQLHQDEKGFWSSVQELAASSECRRPIICTANTFSGSMRQIFIEPKPQTQQDLEQILVHFKTDHLANPIGYKHFEFATRSERQSSAVLKRITQTEEVPPGSDLAESLSILCQNDTRRAVNQLHFWGAPGIERGAECTAVHSPAQALASQERVGVDFVQLSSCSSTAALLFEVGSENFSARNLGVMSSPLKRANDKSSLNQLTLDAWCASIEAISESDAICGVMKSKLMSRNASSLIGVEALCMDTDIDGTVQAAEELNAQALNFSQEVLSFNHGNVHVKDLSERVRSKAGVAEVLSTSPLPKRPMLLEYLPILKSMVAAEDARSGGKTGDVANCATVRRTRQRSRLSGMSTLDLHPGTILALKMETMQ